MRKRNGRGYWLAVTESFYDANFSQAPLCTRHDLNIGTFRSWLYRFRDERATDTLSMPAKVARFVEVMASAPAERCVLRVGHVEIEFHKLPHADYLSALLANLGSTTK